jgi:DNA-3-methyladenine glycosylase
LIGIASLGTIVCGRETGKIVTNIEADRTVSCRGRVRNVWKGVGVAAIDAAAAEDGNEGLGNPNEDISRLERMPREFYDRDTTTVARDLLGKFLVHNAGGEVRIGKIVEVEAYLGTHDRASHSSRGRTERTKIMFGPPGYAYVYMIYGMHFCMNVVTEGEEHGSAVLIRAVEPVRNLDGRTKGPGLLCRAMGIDRAMNGHDLVSEDLYIGSVFGTSDPVIVKRPRIGVEYSGLWARRLLRFYIKGNPFISRA